MFFTGTPRPSISDLVYLRKRCCLGTSTSRWCARKSGGRVNWQETCRRSLRRDTLNYGRIREFPNRQDLSVGCCLRYYGGEPRLNGAQLDESTDCDRDTIKWCDTFVSDDAETSATTMRDDDPQSAPVP